MAMRSPLLVVWLLFNAPKALKTLCGSVRLPRVEQQLQHPSGAAYCDRSQPLGATKKPCRPVCMGPPLKQELLSPE